MSRCQGKNNRPAMTPGADDLTQQPRHMASAPMNVVFVDKLPVASPQRTRALHPVLMQMKYGLQPPRTHARAYMVLYEPSLSSPSLHRLRVVNSMFSGFGQQILFSPFSSSTCASSYLHMGNLANRCPPAL